MLLYEYIHEGSLYDHLNGTILAHSFHTIIGLLEDCWWSLSGRKFKYDKCVILIESKQIVGQTMQCIDYDDLVGK